LEFKRKDQEIQKEAMFFNCAHFIDYFANVSRFDDALDEVYADEANLSIFPTDVCLQKPTGFDSGWLFSNILFRLFD